MDDLGRQIELEGFEVAAAQLGSRAWQMEDDSITRLCATIRDRGTPLKTFLGMKPLYGIKTGFNAAFLIDTATRNKLVADDPRSEEIVRPYLRGQDISRWTPEWDGANQKGTLCFNG